MSQQIATTKTTLKRANETIGMVPTGGKKLSGAIRKLYASILLFSQRQGFQEVYTAKIQDLLAVAGLTSTANYPELKNHFVRLRTYTIQWNTRGKEDEAIWGACGLIEEPKIIRCKNGATTVTWRLADAIKAQLVDPQGFYTKFNLEMMTKLRLGGSIALYEICSRYANNKIHGELGVTAKQPVEHWISMILGYEKSAYEYRFFKRGILNPAIKELNENTDITVFLKEIKTGKKITDLQFLIKRKEETEFSRLSKEIQARLGSVGISKKTTTAVAEAYTPEQISIQLDILEGSTKAGKQIKNPSAFIQAGLKEGWKPPAGDKRKAADIIKAPEPAQVLKVSESIQESVSAELQTQVLDLLEGMESGYRNTLLEEFYMQENNFVKNLYRNQYFDSLVVVAAFSNWYKARG